MPSNTGTPRAVRIIRFLTQFVTGSILLALAAWFYHFATKPYQIRYFVEPSSIQPRGFQASVYSAADVNSPVLVTVDCHGDNVEDLTYRPVLEESRGWSFRELLPAVGEAKPFLTTTAAFSVDEVADRHVRGGLASWHKLEDSNLEDRVKSLLRQQAPRVTQQELDLIADNFLKLSNRHDTTTLKLPASLSREAQGRLRLELNRIEEEWERDVATVTAAWLQRWQTLTGTALLVTPNGIGGTTPIYLSMPPMREGTGIGFGVVHEAIYPATPDPDIKLSVGDASVYKANSWKELKLPSVLLAATEHLRMTAILILTCGIAIAVFLSYRSWPKRLSDPDLYNRARQYQSEELWEELRRRNAWVEPYIVSSFLVHRAGVPGPEVMTFFWRTIRETLNTTQADADSPLQVQLAIQTTLDLAIQNVIP